MNFKLCIQTNRQGKVCRQNTVNLNFHFAYLNLWIKKIRCIKGKGISKGLGIGEGQGKGKGEGQDKGKSKGWV
jgi:hypothetical protein